MMIALSVMHVCLFMSVQGADSVITDVIIQNEKDVPPPGYTLIERTLDSSLFLFHSVLYIVNHKKCATLFSIITMAILDRFLYFMYQ